MIYLGPSPDNPIDQGDIVDQCPLTFLTEYDMDLPGQGEIECVPTRVLVLTQTCDLAHRKITALTAAIVHEAQFIVDQGLLKPADVRGPVRAARVYGWYFLPADSDLGLNEMIVDLRQLHTVRLDLLFALSQRGHRRARLLSPYREHLAKHFADTFSRIGLPRLHNPIPFLENETNNPGGTPRGVLHHELPPPPPKPPPLDPPPPKPPLDQP